jgi:transcriptional regulator with XRE-family HTH domain
MTEPVVALDLRAILRALRRRADISQRELAERSGVPASTIGRIESGQCQDPRLRTVERLIFAAGGSLRISEDHKTPPPPAHPSEGLVDEAGRSYPAHLDVRRVTEAHDWWGAWWANWYDLPRHRWPRDAPDHTYDLDRGRRDQRRKRQTRAAMVSSLRITTAEPDDAPDNVWRWLATDDTGQVVARLGGFVQHREGTCEREFVLCDIEVAPAWQRCGLGQRMVDTLQDRMITAGVPTARVLISPSRAGYEFFRACGFRIGRPPQPQWLVIPAAIPADVKKRWRARRW